MSQQSPQQSSRNTPKTSWAYPKHIPAHLKTLRLIWKSCRIGCRIFPSTGFGWLVAGVFFWFVVCFAEAPWACLRFVQNTRRIPGHVPWLSRTCSEHVFWNGQVARAPNHVCVLAHTFFDLVLRLMGDLSAGFLECLGEVCWMKNWYNICA